MRHQRWLRSGFRCFRHFLAVTFLIFGSSAPTLSADPEPRTSQLSAESVNEALQREIYGLAAEREQLLDLAATNDPTNLAASWHRGLVRDADGKWVSADKFRLPADVERKLAAYSAFRDSQSDDAEGHWKIANWCQRQNLGPQQLAHLHRVLDFAPDHPEARARLGFQRIGTSWILPDQAEEEQRRLEELQSQMEKWTPITQEISRGLSHRSQVRRAAARQKLSELKSEAIPAIEQVLGFADEGQANLAVATIAAFEDRESTLSLTRLGLFSPWESSRAAAADKLQFRNAHEFVPLLLDALQAPLHTRFAAVALPGGGVRYEHVIVRERQTDRDVLVLGTEYQRFRTRERVTSTTPKRDERNNQVKALSYAAQQAAVNESLARIQNEPIRKANDRIIWVLSRSTGKAFKEPLEWWDWWNEQNDVLVEKRTALIAKANVAAVLDQQQPGDTTTHLQTSLPASTQAYYVPPIPRCSCFIAGTPVWTVVGPVPIETVKTGDLVLSKHLETGELTYKPVLRTTVRPPSPLLSLSVADEKLLATRGHLFWVSGEGWKKASELVPGCVLHAASSGVLLSAIDEAPAAETYNLVVADFNTYFVGNAKVLSHDVTVRKPTNVLVPGLRSEEVVSAQ